VLISTFAFSTGPYTFTSLNNGPFGVSTNPAGVIDNWGINMIDPLDAVGSIAEMFSGPGEDQLIFGSPNPPNGLKFYFGADNLGGDTVGFWTASTSTGIPEPSTVTLLIAGMIGLLSLGLKKHA
jgi:hypothetical protein